MKWAHSKHTCYLIPNNDVTCFNLALSMPSDIHQKHKACNVLLQHALISSLVLELSTTMFSLTSLFKDEKVPVVCQVPYNCLMSSAGSAWPLLVNFSVLRLCRDLLCKWLRGARISCPLLLMRQESVADRQFRWTGTNEIWQKTEFQKKV